MSTQALTLNILGQLDASYGKAVGEVNKSIEKIDAQNKKLSEKFKNTGKSISDGGKKMAAFGAAGVAAFGLAVKASTDFNASMSNVATLIPDSTERVNELKKEVQNLAAETVIGTDIMSEGLYNTISAFGDTADTVAILETNAKAAKAGMATVADSINLTSAITKAYGDTSAEAVSKVADLSLLTVRLGQTTFPELAASMGQVTPIAEAMGVSQEELFATMAASTGVIGTASEVATKYKAALLAIMTPKKDMQVVLQQEADNLIANNKIHGEAVDRYKKEKAVLDNLTKSYKNQNTATAEGKKKSQELKKAIDDQSDSVGALAAKLAPQIIETQGFADTLAAVTKASEDTGKPLSDFIGSSEGVSFALAMSGNVGEDYTNKLKEMQNATGATDEAFKEVAEGINEAGFKMEQAKIQAEILAQNMGDALVPILVSVFEKIKPLIEQLTIFAQENPNVVLFIAALTAAITVIGTAAVVLGTIISSIGTIITLFGTIKAMVIGWTAAVTASTFATSAFAAVIGFLGSPIVAITLVIAAVIAVIWLLYKNWGTVSTFLMNTFNRVSAVLTTHMSNIASVFSDRFALIGLFFKAFASLARKVWDSIGLGAKSMANGVVDALNGMIRALNRLKINVPDWVPLLGGKSFSMNIKPLPRFAKGGSFITNGPQIVGGALVGENTGGRELITVTPLSSPNINGPQIGGGDTYNINISISNQGGSLPRSMADDLVRELIPKLQKYKQQL